VLFRRWQIGIAGTLIVLALLFYGLRWELYPGGAMHREMLRYLVDDVAFLFIQVLLVSMLVDGILQRRAHDATLNKLNMVIGAFFSECGTDLLKQLARADVRLPEVQADLVAIAGWSAPQYQRARRSLREHRPRIDLTSYDLAALRRTLSDEKPFLLSLLGNQVLLEHEAFTDLLWAVTHLAEELAARNDLNALSGPDARHLAGDMERVYTRLALQWIAYLAHLQAQYPYLFSLAARTNPLDPAASAIVVE
jgi:hypothetical protein